MNLVSDGVRVSVEKIFCAPEVGEVIFLLESASFPRVGDNLSRVQLALLILSKGSLRIFKKSLEIAKSDWRDVLIAAGLGNADWRDIVNLHGLSDD